MLVNKLLASTYAFGLGQGVAKIYHFVIWRIVHSLSNMKVRLSPSKICFICFNNNEKNPSKIMKKTLFHLKSSFHSEDI